VRTSRETQHAFLFRQRGVERERERERQRERERERERDREREMLRDSARVLMGYIGIESERGGEREIQGNSELIPV